ncbi:hypothetical protein B4U45_00820 [Mycobacterium persicum]|uniref:Uncharacterized protein n=1 Tax=Mycobacterium persicum TaxID=1487726 RepID=A0A8E2LMY1_9MYCO|nr:hypothetical protein [Mycobacterium persicum]KZS82565.1 hypothetical protein A4G31_00770 [Mycobacterium persicum]ORB37064.1 hypothetical protein BST40_23930 [Mycobacterium persicum]ORB93353.1 hypothetical protein B1T44_00825 [Mycobacterium persicum]ORC05435.1 hypothetical protein B4U45_00820 [Mycobacterium persicum]VAZ75954.1 hypothetical protein LAUMK15_03086 [Mycobacterium persicum]
MLSLRDHRVEDYTELADMDGTDVGVLTADDRACLSDLGAYLVAAGAWHRFGVWLLHKHFDPEPGEVFVERVIDWPPQTHTTPIERNAFSPAGLRATAVRFDSEHDCGMSLVGMEFAGPADFGDTAPINDSDDEVLAGLAQRLHDHGKIDRFGVRLIRNPSKLSETKVFSETCDPWRRALHCDVIDRTQTPDNAIETYWQCKPTLTETGPTATLTFLTGCRQFCTPLGSGVHHHHHH